MTATDDVKALRAELDELRALIATTREAPPAVAPAWGVRTCQTCGALADVVDLAKPDDWPAEFPWNGEGYCAKHADKEGVTKRAHLTRPGPKRRDTP